MRNNQNRLLCLGFGYTAKHFSSALDQKIWSVYGTTRSAENLNEISSLGVKPIHWENDTLTPSAFTALDAILVSTAPNNDGCPALRQCMTLLDMNEPPRWIGYLSSNGVYGDHGGAWVDEDSSLRAVTNRSKKRVDAERQWMTFAKQNALPLVIFRLPGIYGPGRSALDRTRAGRAKRVFKEGQVFSRAHVDDIVTALLASLATPTAGTLFNIADDEPSPSQDVIEYACSLLNIKPPPLKQLEEAELSEMGRSFYLENKRVRNTRMKEALGVELRYPSYREGLNAIAAE